MKSPVAAAGAAHGTAVALDPQWKQVIADAALCRWNGQGGAGDVYCFVHRPRFGEVC
jgi:hypothetical protein